MTRIGGHTGRQEERPGARRDELGRRGFVRGAAGAVATGALLAGAGAAPAVGVPAEGRRIRVVAEERVDERLLRLTVDSPALGGTEAVELLVPTDWDRRGPDAGWPTLYLLPGGDGEPTIWTEQHRVQDLDEFRQVLVVMTAMPLFGFHTDWWNGGAGGPPAVETFHVHELIPLLERAYGAGRRRAVGGDSQGGYGALGYAARHPGLFRAVASYSGPLHPLAHPEVWLGGARLFGIDGTAIWGDPVAQRANWRAHDPYFLADRLGGTPVYISAGDGTMGMLDDPDREDDPVIPGTEEVAESFPDNVVSLTEGVIGRESRATAERLIAAGTPVTAHFYPGTHTGTYGWRELRLSMPLLLGALLG
ncbi:alpha/beta hydrolase-fold protein [Streptomyces sp. B6B3]|uniref:alpha/beta hydrolase n=1 Tax=Streptomyces sp. B6B3 TaxID=3153570 RepID=UPI00325E4206